MYVHYEEKKNSRKTIYHKTHRIFHATKEPRKKKKKLILVTAQSLCLTGHLEFYE